MVHSLGYFFITAVYTHCVILLCCTRTKQYLTACCPFNSNILLFDTVTVRARVRAYSRVFSYCVCMYDVVRMFLLDSCRQEEQSWGVFLSDAKALRLVIVSHSRRGITSAAARYSLACLQTKEHLICDVLSHSTGVG